MKPTKAINLITASILGAVVAYLLSIWSVRTGRPLPISTPSMLTTLPLIALVLLLIAIPIFKYRSAVKAAIEKKTSQTKPVKRLDPFYAIRVAMLAKATSIAGAIFVGWHVGVLLTVLGQPTEAATAIVRCVFGITGAVLMIVSGIIVERACRIPPDAGDTDASAA